MRAAERQRFPIFPLEYFRRTWRLFAPQCKLRILLAYADGEPLAGVVATVVGDRVHDGWAGMSPNRTNLKANYVTHWEAIRWAAQYKYYDFSDGGDDGGVDRFKVVGRGDGGVSRPVRPHRAHAPGLQVAWNPRVTCGPEAE